MTLYRLYIDLKPGPASTVEDRPPSNPAIGVRLPPSADNVFKRTHIDGTTIYWWQWQKAKAPSLDNSGRYNFHCTKKNIPTNWPYDVNLRVWNDVTNNNKLSQGWLVQWKTVRLQIQRSGFASCLGQQMILLSRVFKCTHIDGTTIYWWQRQKAKAPSLDNSGRYNFHCTKKERTYKLALWRRS